MGKQRESRNTAAQQTMSPLRIAEHTQVAARSRTTGTSAGVRSSVPPVISATPRHTTGARQRRQLRTARQQSLTDAPPARVTAHNTRVNTASHSSLPCASWSAAGIGE
ncbi:hypothetical protein TRVL_09622 [Trypanosoma vivax]|uniref:Uncharacterized protein n=1 Tax=Trypanosoma vivax (strain Y486) TaxID=1055687 RepID=G0U0Y4_TRYVY|nr:hypothetical protein TRVL_09622 [Trypanosoma vivax]CCC49739.1 hypothetical protein, unlikely [Trypanosoma vivax Y486]